MRRLCRDAFSKYFNSAVPRNAVSGNFQVNHCLVWGFNVSYRSFVQQLVALILLWMKWKILELFRLKIWKSSYKDLSIELSYIIVEDEM